MKKVIEQNIFDEERALYHLEHADVVGCVFAGVKDGESVLKEVRDVTVKDCTFSLRYPLWHAQDYHMVNSIMDGKTRAPIWYAQNGKIENSMIDGIKCLRECKGIEMDHCIVHSPEFGWRCRDIIISNSAVESEYFLFESENIQIHHLQMQGKYSFQYIKNARIQDSVLDTKDAFWHSEGVTVKNSVVRGEYLGWYSEGLTLINCEIIGTQPLCYCKNLKLVDCRMQQTDLAFEYSDVEADIIGEVMSIKNPKSGKIVVDDVGEIIWSDSVVETKGEILLREKR